MDINGKEYDINLSCPIKYLEKIDDIQKISEFREILKYLLIPKPSEKDIGEMGIDIFWEVFAEFGKKMKEKVTEYKKASFQ